MDDIQVDKDLQKGIKMFKNEDRLRHMNKEQLEKEIQEMEMVDLLEDLHINEPAEQNAQPALSK